MKWLQTFERFINKKDLDDVEKYADDKLSPVDVEFAYHFFQQLKNKRNKPAISKAELIGFFKRLAKNQRELETFLAQYDEIVITDKRNDINIPFAQMANQIIAKTVMRKKDFKTSNKKLKI